MRSRGAVDFNSFLVNCIGCHGTTSRKYAREHQGRCKSCVVRPQSSMPPARNERILESGYSAYAREEGHYDYQE